VKEFGKYFICAVFSASLIVPVFAQNTRRYELATSDSELNRVYSSIIRRLDAKDAASLRAAQRLWIQFRDADCKLALADVRDCLIIRTDQRVEQLKSTYYTDKTGDVFSVGDG
jgi:uncharacterized protein YecT (DUF1311 family)